MKYETIGLIVFLITAICGLVVIGYIQSTEKIELAKLGYEQTRLDGVTIWIKRGIIE